jgi:nucleotide-binding universal stress UspA family protein
VERILVALDLSEASHQVLQTGLELSRAFAARLNVVHVIPMLTYTPEFSSLHTLLGSSRAEVEMELDDFVSSEMKGTVQEGVLVDQNVREGSVDQEILEEAKQWKASMIVLGTQSGPVSGRPFLGSVATHVLSHASIPVLLVREKTIHDAPGSILAAVDGSESTEPVLRVAAEWAAKLSKKLTVAHVVEELPERLHVKVGSKPEFETKIKQLRAEQQKRIEAVVQKLFATGPVPAVHHRIGRPYLEVCAEAREGRHDLVIVGRLGWSRISRLGSTAARIAHASPCSVLVDGTRPVGA